MATDQRSGDNTRHMDPETLNKQQRIRAIHDARQHVHEKIDDAYDALATDSIDRALANTIVRRSIEQYIMEIEALVKSDAEYKETYWDSYELGTMQLPTRSEEFVGLKSILEAPEFIEDSWDEQVMDDVQGKRTREQAVQQQIPMDILMSAYRAANAACADVGLDLDVQEAQEFEFDYSDIVE